MLIDKTLIVTGPRQFKKKWALIRLVQWAIKWSTLTLIRPNPWTLTSPKRIVALPLRYEVAYGGQCRINERDNAHLAEGHPKQQRKLQNKTTLARRVARKFRLTLDQQAGHPDSAAPLPLLPVAHTVCEANPVGVGFAEAWFLKVTRLKRLPAPQIEHPKSPITAHLFWKALRGPLKPKAARAFAPAGLGIRYKPHPQRRVLLGTVDEAFIQSAAWLPVDFDFAVWNAAPPDQQTESLIGNEIIELTNLCAPDTPGARRDKTGDTRLTLELPRHDCFALLRMESGAMHEVPFPIDTVLIEPETRSPTLVRRLVFLKDDEAPVRVIEARLRTVEARDALIAARRVLTAVADKAARSTSTDTVRL